MTNLTIRNSSEEQKLSFGGGVKALPGFSFGSFGKAVRGGSEAVEKRNLRRIKNRESASRSRAKKLAYIIQKQLEIKELKKENELLRDTIKVLSTKVEVLKQDGDDQKTSLIRTLSGPL